MRISGFASGMDIDQMVSDLMKAERIPLQRMEQEKQELEWKRDDYRAINTLLLDFRSSLTDMRMTTSFRARQTSSTNESMVTATASSAASQSSFQLSKAEQLATSASWVNAGNISQNEKINAANSLFSENSKLANGITWQQGVVTSKNVMIDSPEKITLADDISANVDLAATMDIRVNGKGYKVVDSSTDLQDNEVYVDQATGALTFKEGAVKKGDEISAQYVKDNNTVERTLSEGSNTINLGSASIVADENFSVTIDGVDYKVGEMQENGNYSLVDSSGASIGELNAAAGRVIVDTPFEETTDVSATYQQHFTSFSLGAATSKGETYRNILVKGNESLNQVTNRVNSADLGLSMMYDSFSDQLSLRRTETGDYSDGNDIFISGALMTDVLQFNEEAHYTEGQNAKFTINGLDTERHTNNFQIDGVTFQLKQTFDAIEENISPVSINVTNDSEAVFENIKEFVETYNTLIDEINKKVNEPFHRDYSPLTDEERESLTEKQQEDWEEMARSGLLRRDSILQSLLSTMRTDFYSPVNNDAAGSINQLAQIGITTTNNYMEGGKLEINEAKLKEAIESDPSGVENLFRGDGNEYGEKGIARRLTDSINQTMDRIYERAGRATATNHQFTLGRNLNDIEQQMDRFEDRLGQIEDRYWRQFTAMEKAMQQANSQAMYMQQQFMGMQ